MCHHFLENMGGRTNTFGQEQRGNLFNRCLQTEKVLGHWTNRNLVEAVSSIDIKQISEVRQFGGSSTGVRKRLVILAYVDIMNLR